jgi:hypothetical protein
MGFATRAQSSCLPEIPLDMNEYVSRTCIHASITAKKGQRFMRVAVDSMDE